MGGSLGASEKQKQVSTPPAWWEGAAKDAIAWGKDTAKIGYVPYMGPEIAAFNPQMIDAMQQSADWSAAFNTPGQSAPQVSASLMPATDYGNGMMGYSSYPGYLEQIGQLEQTYPGIAGLIKSFFIDPVTGQMPGADGTNTPGSGTGNNGNFGNNNSNSNNPWAGKSGFAFRNLNGGGQGGMGQGGLAARGGMTRGPQNINAGGPLDPRGGLFGAFSGGGNDGGFNHGFAQ
jgi:hypothetical protein